MSDTGDDKFGPASLPPTLDDGPKPVTSNSTKAKHRKRKRGGITKRDSVEEQHAAEKRQRYDALARSATTAVLRAGRAVRASECNRVIKLLRNLRESDAKKSEGGEEKRGASEKAREKRRRRMENLERRLADTKAFNLDRLVGLCFKRLGISNLNPREYAQDHPEKGDNEKAEANAAGDEFRSDLAESMLRHSRLVAALDDLDARVTEYRRWVLRREEYLASKRGNLAPELRADIGGGRKKKGAENRHFRGRDGVDQAGHDGASGLFVGSLSGNTHPEEGGEAGYDDEFYGPGADDDDPLAPRKKKRAGQRARRAKGMAKEARREGRTWDSSINWRGSKTGVRNAEEGRDVTQRSTSARGRRNDTERSRRVEGAKSTRGETKEAAASHPSWVARQANKAKEGIGIVQFQGKKITFD